MIRLTPNLISNDIDIEIDSLKSALFSFRNEFTDSSLWVQGTISVSDGTTGGSSVRICTDFITSNITGINVLAGYECGVLCWDTNDIYQGAWTGSAFSKIATTWFEGTVDFAKISNYKIKFNLKNYSGTSITVSAASNVVLYKYTDATLSKIYIPADAKSTGDAIQALADKITTSAQPYKLLTKSSDVFIVVPDSYATTGNIVELTGYQLYYFTVENDCYVYFDSATLARNGALFLSIYNTSIASGNNVACYKRSDNTLPSDASKARVYAGQILAISIYAPAASPVDFGAYCNYEKFIQLQDDLLLDDSQIDQVLNRLPSDFAGKLTNFADSKKIAWFGDSISQLKLLPHIVGGLLNANVIDCSIKGSTIGETYSNFNAFSFYNLVSAIISGSFTSQESQYNAYTPPSGVTKLDIRENLDHIEQTDFGTVDYVVLLQGTNDFGIQVYTVETDLSSASRNYAVNGYFCYDQKRYKVTSAIQQGDAIVIGTNCVLSVPKVDSMKELMDDAISRFITVYPSIKFFIISPPFRKSPTEDQFGNTLADYIAAEQEVAEKYAIPFYNLLTHSRICDENKTIYMNSDSGIYVHPNDYGDAWLAELCYKFISIN